MMDVSARQRALQDLNSATPDSYRARRADRRYRGLERDRKSRRLKLDRCGQRDPRENAAPRNLVARPLKDRAGRRFMSEFCFGEFPSDQMLAEVRGRELESPQAGDIYAANDDDGLGPCAWLLLEKLDTGHWVGVRLLPWNRRAQAPLRLDASELCGDIGLELRQSAFTLLWWRIGFVSPAALESIRAQLTP